MGRGSGGGGRGARRPAAGAPATTNNNAAGFFTPDQIERRDTVIPLNGALPGQAGRLDIVALDDGTIFEVDRANGYVLTGQTRDRVYVGIDLRTDRRRAWIISKARFRG